MVDNQQIPLVIGILVDVSASMREAIYTSEPGAVNRLEAFSKSLENLVKRAATSHRENHGDTAPSVRLFAYGFGFGNVLSALLGKSGQNVRDLLAPGGRGERTMDVVQLADHWDDHSKNVRSMAIDMFGDTPMRKALELAQIRIEFETSERPTRSVLYVLSDGEPTDGSPDNILAIASKIKANGTTLVSCFVTNADITDPKHLYATRRRGWPDAATLMFDCASTIEPGTSFETYLHEYGWRVEEYSRKDMDFANGLEVALKERGFEALQQFPVDLNQDGFRGPGEALWH
jgi:von Willebrand factor type A domain